MGQYFKAVNIDKREFVNPHTLGDGAKLPEIIGSANGLAGALALLLMEGPDDGLCMSDVPREVLGPVMGRWTRDRITLLGDYAYAEERDPEEMGFRDISEEVALVLGLIARE